MTIYNVVRKLGKSVFGLNYMVLILGTKIDKHK